MWGQKGNLEKFRGKSVNWKKNWKAPNRGFPRGPIQPTHPLSSSPLSHSPLTPLSDFPPARVTTSLHPPSLSLSLSLSLLLEDLSLSLPHITTASMNHQSSIDQLMHVPSRSIQKVLKWQIPTLWQPKCSSGGAWFGALWSHALSTANRHSPTSLIVTFGPNKFFLTFSS